jgi:hypothetical protein
LIAGQAAGKRIVAGADGLPVLSDPPVMSYSQIAADYLDTVRITRESILNRISGIGFAAMADGDTATVDGIVTARQALLDITHAPGVLAATDGDELKTAVLAVYKAIASAAPASIRSAFNAVGL